MPSTIGCNAFSCSSEKARMVPALSPDTTTQITVKSSHSLVQSGSGFTAANYYVLSTDLGRGGGGGAERDDEPFELARVGVEAPDAFGELVGRHRVLVVEPPESFLVERDFLDARAPRRFRRQAPLHRPGRARELLQQIG